VQLEHAAAFEGGVEDVAERDGSAGRRPIAKAESLPTVYANVVDSVQ
jgi:hypothetical protein